MPRERAMIADRVGIDAGGVAQPDAAFRDELLVELIMTNGARLDEPQGLCIAQQVIVPEAGCNQDITLANPRARIFWCPGLKVGNLRSSHREPLGQAIGAMGKVDGNLVRVWKVGHKRSLDL